MDSLVAIQVREVGELLATSFALIGLDRQVNPLVVVEVIHFEERFWTELTLVTPLGKVIPLHVVAEDGSKFVALLTELTGEDCLVLFMCFIHMSVEGALPGKGFLTE